MCVRRYQRNPATNSDRAEIRVVDEQIPEQAVVASAPRSDVSCVRDVRRLVHPARHMIVRAVRCADAGVDDARVLDATGCTSCVVVGACGVWVSGSRPNAQIVAASLRRVSTILACSRFTRRRGTAPWASAPPAAARPRGEPRGAVHVRREAMVMAPKLGVAPGDPPGSPGVDRHGPAPPYGCSNVVGSVRIAPPRSISRLPMRARTRAVRSDRWPLRAFAPTAALQRTRHLEHRRTGALWQLLARTTCAPCIGQRATGDPGRQPDHAARAGGSSHARVVVPIPDTHLTMAASFATSWLWCSAAQGDGTPQWASTYSRCGGARERRTGGSATSEVPDPFGRPRVAGQVVSCWWPTESSSV